MIFCNLSPEEWNVIISLSSLIVVVFGIVIALKNLSIIAKSQKLEVLDSFINELKANENSRKFLFKKYKFETIDKLDENSVNEIEKVINSLNRISLLLDNKLIDSNVIFGLCHTMIIRCEFLLRDYISAKENIIGGRYGMRIIKLTSRAKKFHDTYKYHRSRPININLEKESIKIYETTLGNSFEEKLNNQLEWSWRRLWKLY